MKIMIEHLKQRTIPHDLLEYFTDVAFYEGCMIVQIHDHKSTAPSQGVVKPAPGTGKLVPFSVHNYNAYLTPSSYEPFPTQTALAAGNIKSEEDDITKSKSSEQKDKENMPAPSLPNDGQRRIPKKAKVITVVLHPTALCNLFDFSNIVVSSRSNADARRESRQDFNAGPLSASVPPTPTIPATPQTMAPPAKRVKRTKMQSDSTNFYSKEAHIILATTAPLVLNPISSTTEAAALLDSLAHPMHSDKPPAPKTRKRTVAEMAADEALAADQERYMLVLDERLSSTAGAQGGANSTGDGGQAGGASFEPRFERFTLLEGIKQQHEENKKAEKLRAAEADRKRNQEQERNKLRDEAEKREQQKLQMQASALQQQSAQRQQQQQELNRRQMAEQAQRAQMQGMGPQAQAVHAHPQTNGNPTNGIPAQTQRFHQQQATQAQLSSPIVRNGTPQNHSSPSVNNMGNVPMQHSTSSMGGSPQRPGSVVQQNHPQMSAPTSHGMVAQRSQQSHAGTPRMPNSTPNMQSTPINRQMSQQTPRMGQGSPQGVMPQTPQIPMMNGQPQITQSQMTQAQFQQQARMQQMMRNQQQQQQAAQGMGGMMPAQLTPQQQLQIQMMRTQQQQALQQQQAMPNQLIQNYAAQMAAMSARSGGGMTPNINQNFNNGMPNNMQMNPAQMQQLRQQQIMQAQAQAQQHAMQQQQQHHPQGQVPMNQQQMLQQQIMAMAGKMFQSEKMKLAGQYPGGIPDELTQQLQQRCHAMAQRHIQTMMQKNAQARVQQQQQQAQMMAAQGMTQNMSGMQNGMGM
jgi:transcription factor SPT20